MSPLFRHGTGREQAEVVSQLKMKGRDVVGFSEWIEKPNIGYPCKSPMQAVHGWAPMLRLSYILFGLSGRHSNVAKPQWYSENGNIAHLHGATYICKLDIAARHRDALLHRLDSKTQIIHRHDGCSYAYVWRRGYAIMQWPPILPLPTIQKPNLMGMPSETTQVTSHTFQDLWEGC